MSQVVRVAVVLSGCGVYDGSEIYESVITLLRLDEKGASVQVFAPDKEQMHVINHLSGEAQSESRNVLVEAARLARGEISALSELKAENFDALIVPGGFGAAKNLCNFAVAEGDFDVDTDFLKAVRDFKAQSKPVGLMCIAPVMAVKLFGEGIKCTLGRACDASNIVESSGGVHVETSVESICVDEKNKLVTTSAYMQAERIFEAAQGINALVDKVLSLAAKY